MLFCDFHTHILPGMDDGAKDVQTSVKMLDSIAEQHMDVICFTPHYSHHRESVKSFIQRREAAFSKLSEAYEGSLPEIRMGAEVCVERGLTEDEDIESLCYTGTRAMLLELPFRELTRQSTDELENLALSRKIVPVIAHLERYFTFFTDDDIDRLLSVPGVVIQFNAEALDRRVTRKRIMHFMQEGIPVVFGSDAHDTLNRPPELRRPLERFLKHLAPEATKLIERTEERLFSGVNTSMGGKMS